MDKNSIIGLILIGVIFFGFTIYSSKQQKKIAEEQARLDSISWAESVQTERLRQEQQAAVSVDSIQQAVSLEENRKQMLGETLFAATQGTEAFYTLENDKIKVILSSKGGIVSGVELKDYKTYDGKPLELFKPQSAYFNIGLFTNQTINTSQFFFQNPGQQQVLVKEGEEGSIALRLYADSLSYVEYLYTLKSGEYMLNYQINFVGMDGIISPAQRDFSISWGSISPQQERGYSYENQYTTVAYNQPGSSDVEELSISTGTKEETINTKLRWVAFKQQFFSSILLAENNFDNGEVKYETMPEYSGDIKKFSAELRVPYAPEETSYRFNFYFGPNSYIALKQYDEHFQKLIPLGWGIFGWINRFIVIPTFNFLGKYISNYGWIILILTVFIKLLIFPFTYKSYLSMAKMRLLKPELDAINQKFPNREDAMKKQQAMMELYRRAGVSPMGGCLPLLFQFPVLIAMFRFFPASIELRGEHFLWAQDLSSYDSILNLPFSIPFYGNHVSLFALLMGLSLFAASKINFAQNSASSSQMPGMTFMTLYLMPIMMILWFNNYASGLSYYYFLSNLITIVQSFVFRRCVSDEKLHQQMKDNAKKPRKKSKWQARYEEMIRQQQELARQQQKQQRKR